MSRVDDNRGDPTVLSSWRESSTESSDPLWVRFEGTGNEGKKAGKMGYTWPLF